MRAALSSIAFALALVGCGYKTPLALPKPEVQKPAPKKPVPQKPAPPEAQPQDDRQPGDAGTKE